MRGYISNTISHLMIGQFLLADLRVVAVVAAVVLYGVMGTPTPDSVGLVEVVVGALLVFGIGAGGFLGVLTMRGSGGSEGAWYLWGQVFLVYGVVIGGIGAIFNGADIAGIARDLLPFGFMFLPLFMVGLFCRTGAARGYVWAFVMLGVLFAVRAGAPVFGVSFDVGYEALYYLGNSPSVLFAALYLMGCGLLVLSRGVNLRGCLIAGVCFGVCAVVIVPIVMTAQRASLAAIVVYGVLAFGVLFMRAPRRMVIVGAVMAVIVSVLFAGFIGAAFESAADKSALVGANMRFEEWAAVWAVISGHPLTFLFGQGWGASFASPAVADIEVNFTHSLLSSMLLKVGLVGFALCTGYIGALFFAVLRCFRGNEIIVMAVAAPLLIDVFLYAAFKSLDFGLLLGVIVLVINWRLDASRIASKPRVLYEKHEGAVQ